MYRIHQRAHVERTEARSLFKRAVKCSFVEQGMGNFNGDARICSEIRTGTTGLYLKSTED
jgi:hypothetical protein